jgi:non-ribosomal peptide synthetase component F
MLERNDFDQLQVAASKRTKEKDFWLNKLSGIPEKTAFPYDYRKISPDNRQPGEITFEYPAETAAKLMKLSTGSDVRLYILLTAGLIALLHKYTGINDITIGTPIFKPEKGGNVINTVLPLRNEINKNTTFKELVLEVRQTIVDADEHRNYPVEILSKQLGMVISGEDFPLFEVVISIERVHDKSFLKPFNPKMAFNFRRTGDRIEGTIQYNSLFYNKNTIERIIAHKVNLLEQVLSGPDLPLSGLELVTGKEKEQLLFGFNSKEIQYASDKTLVELFAEQVEKTPHHYACFEKGKYLTYEDLNHRANLLAKKIKDM